VSLELLARAKPAQVIVRIFCGSSYGRFVMKAFRMRRPTSRAALVTAAIVAAVWTSTALAAQGPGSGMGTASHLTQTVMAVLVYGASVIIVGAGLIGAVRRR
jgi:hypothetical protein